MKADNPKRIDEKDQKSGEPHKHCELHKPHKPQAENSFIRNTVQNPFEKLMRLRKELNKHAQNSL